ncbi:MAG: hypothetical protein ACYCPT_03995 [Acidimicrobiales bacterium]
MTSRAQNSARRGVVARTSGMIVGLLVAGAIVVGMQLPLLHRPSRTQLFVSRVFTSPRPASLAWPSVGSAALDIPALGVVLSHHNRVVPIASLTKMIRRT